MYCPACGGEYLPGIETCPTCEVALTEEGPRESEAPRSPSPRLVPVMVDLVGFIDEHEARDARRRLKGAKIPSELVIRDAFHPAGSDGMEPQPLDEQAGDEYWIRVPAGR